MLQVWMSSIYHIAAGHDEAAADTGETVLAAIADAEDAVEETGEEDIGVIFLLFSDLIR